MKNLTGPGKDAPSRMHLEMANMGLSWMEKGSMNNAAQEKNQTEAQSMNNSQRYQRWLEPASVVIFWSGVGYALYVWILLSIWHIVLTLLMLAYHVLWIQKKKISVLPRRFVDWIVACSAYKILHENFVIMPKKGSGLYNWLCCGHFFLIISYCLGYSNFRQQDTGITINDMQSFHGRYERLQQLGNRNLCGRYIITFRQEDGCEISFYASRPGEIIQSKELFSLCGLQNKPQECRDYLELKQVIGEKYQLLYNQERVKRRDIVAWRIFFSGLTISACLYAGVFIVAQLAKPKASLPQNDTK